jgi:4,5:9,10-diseco-3-hydroxy-5,9,17-trioxoandrosta-1(10),2-diene-4-oate hydrolase
MDVLQSYLESQARHFESEGVSPKSEFIETSGPVRKVHYLTSGSGSPLILIHGGGGNVDQWTNLIKSLQSHFKLYIIDRPGCGQTDKFDYTGIDLQHHAIDFIKSFMDAAGIQKANLAANSMGGLWSTLFALKYPDYVEKFVLLGAPAGIYDRKLPFFFKLLGVKGLNRFLYATIAKPSIKGTRQLYKQLIVADAEKLSEQLIETGYLGSIIDGAVNSWLSLLENVTTMKGMQSHYLLSGKIDNLKVQTLVLWGDSDAFNTPEEGMEVCKNNNRIEFVKVENAGHLPWLDQRDFCSDRMIKFLMNN